MSKKMFGSQGTPGEIKKAESMLTEQEEAASLEREETTFLRDNRETALWRGNTEMGGSLFFFSEGDISFIVEKDAYVDKFKIVKGSELIDVSVDNYNLYLEKSDFDKICGKIVELLKSDASLSKVKEVLTKAVDDTLEKYYRDTYSSQIILKNGGLFIESPEGEMVQLYRTSYAGPHYLVGETKDGKKEVTVYNRWSDSTGESKLERESIQWGAKDWDMK